MANKIGNGSAAPKKSPTKTNWFTSAVKKKPVGQSDAAIKAAAARYKGEADVWANGGMTGRWGQGLGMGNAAANAALGPGVQDQFGGASLWDLMAGLNGGAAPSSGSGGGRSGGGGGGGGGMDAAALDEMLATGNQSYDALLAQQLAAYAAANASQIGALDAANATANEGFTQRGTQLSNTAAGAKDRLAGILGGLQSSAAQTRGTVRGSYDQTDNNLEGLMSQYAQMAAGRDAGANQTLSAFGAAPVGPSGNNVQDLLMAGRGANTMRAGAADAMYAGRGNVYSGLNADAATQSGSTFDMLMAQLQAAQQQSSAGYNTQKAQLAMKAAEQDAAAKIQSETAKQQLALQLLGQK